MMPGCSTLEVALPVYHAALINALQHCSELDEASVDVAAPDEGICSIHVVDWFEVAPSPIRSETSCLRGGGITVDEAHLFIGVRHMHAEKMEGPLGLIRSESSDKLVVCDDFCGAETYHCQTMEIAKDIVFGIFTDWDREEDTIDDIDQHIRENCVGSITVEEITLITKGE